MHFSWGCLTVNTMSTVLLSGLKPHCASGRVCLETVMSLLRMTRAKIFPATERKEIPLCRQIGNRGWVAKLTCAWKFYSEKTGAQFSRLGKSWSSGTKNRYDGRLPGCSGWPGLLWVPHPALGAPTTLAATTFTTVGSLGELFCLFRRESGFACSRADTAQFKLTEG